MKKLIAGLLIVSVIAATACTGAGSESRESANALADNYASMTPEEICASLTLEQKAAQMMQTVIYNVNPAEMKNADYGSVIGRIDNWPMPKVDAWKETVTSYQQYALQSAAKIPYIYGNDSVHGVNFASGCVIFPHNINIGAANDVALTEEYGKIVGS